MSDVPSTGKVNPATAGFNLNLFKAKGIVRQLPFTKAKEPAHQNKPDEFDPPLATLLGNPMYFRVKIDGAYLPNEPLVMLTGSKVIVKTQIAGGNGTVKEMIGEDDYRINIKGRAVRETANRYRSTGGLVPEDYPEEWMRELARIWKLNRDVAVECQLLTYFNISRMVIEDITFPPVPGESGSFYYEINAVSDESSVAKLIRK